MNASASRTKKVMRRARIRRWRSRLLRSKRLRILVNIQFAAVIYAIGYFTPRAMRLPEKMDPVSVINSNGRLHTATLWEDGKFHSVETGETIPQVVKWTKP